MSESFTIAIDGPAAAGKGTISKAVAAHYGFGHLDTGLLYRAVGAKMLEGVAAIEAAEGLTPEDLARDDLRGPEVAQAASKVAVIAEVRAALVDFQRAFARRASDAEIAALDPRLARLIPGLPDPAYRFDEWEGAGVVKGCLSPDGSKVAWFTPTPGGYAVNVARVPKK